ncbi:MAG: capsule biosynthesis protein CapA [Rubricella sp.]
MNRHIVFLQGPHGPFFNALARGLRTAGAGVSRVGFTAGDAAGWIGLAGYDPWRGGIDGLEPHLESHFRRKGATDIVLYGDARPCHRIALDLAKRSGLTIHFFEEGYLRPYWATYERGGVNGGSRLVDIPLAAMERALASRAPVPKAVPDQWGAALAHAGWGAAYHLASALGGRRYPGHEPHRGMGIGREAWLNAARIASQPASALRRRAGQARLLGAGVPYHVALLQLSHDSAVRRHSRYASNSAFAAEVIAAFAAGAPGHHHLVFKRHPFDDGREPLAAMIRRLAERAGVAARVHVHPAGRLGSLLDAAVSAVTINSTSAHQALWRGLPVLALGRAAYARPGIVSGQALPDFFADPESPDREAYLTFRAFLLATSQIEGGFYTARGRAAVLRRAVDLVLADRDPYAALLDHDGDRAARIVPGARRSGLATGGGGG